jgi:uncharacterized protein (DUF488 family)
MELFTIGHSNHSPERFIKLLEDAGIDEIIDVRSTPYSQWAQFANRETLGKLLASLEICYLYMGGVLGGHIPDLQGNKKADRLKAYEGIRQTPVFKQGIDKVIDEMDHRRVCILCAEEDPESCHRRLLVGKSIIGNGINVIHLRGDGSQQTEEELWKEHNHINKNQIGLPL